MMTVRRGLVGEGVKRRSGYNPKRQLMPRERFEAVNLEYLASRVQYGGNPEHKRIPGDYGLTPPRNPRPGKTLCDAQGALTKREALGLLKVGFAKGMVSSQLRGGWPQNVWAVGGDGTPFEAQLENAAQGVYHGYPMPTADDFRDIVCNEWQRR